MPTNVIQFHSVLINLKVSLQYSHILCLRHFAFVKAFFLSLEVNMEGVRE